MTSSTSMPVITSVIGNVNRSADAPPAISTAMIASGP